MKPGLQDTVVVLQPHRPVCRHACVKLSSNLRDLSACAAFSRLVLMKILLSNFLTTPGGSVRMTSSVKKWSFRRIADGTTRWSMWPEFTLCSTWRDLSLQIQAAVVFYLLLQSLLKKSRKMRRKERVSCLCIYTHTPDLSAGVGDSV